MKFLVPLFLLAILTAGSAFSSPLWTIEESQSHLRFEGKDNGADFSGEFKKFTAEIIFDAKNLAESSIKVVVDTSSAITGNQTYDSSLPASEWFNVENFPNATFQSSSITYIGADKEGVEAYEAMGKLTMLGITKDLKVPFSLKMTGNMAQASGTLVLKRLDFGLGKTVDAKGGTVSNDITVKFDITAHQ